MICPGCPASARTTSWSTARSQDASRVFVTIGVAGRGPVDALLRSPVMFSWFDSAGVEEIPPMFAGEVVEKLDLDPRGRPVRDSPAR